MFVNSFFFSNFFFPGLERRKEIRPNMKMGFSARKIEFNLRAKEQRGKFCAGGGVARDAESYYGKQSGRKGGAVRKPTHKAFDAQNLHQHPRNCLEDHSFGFKDRDQARPRIPLRLRGREGSDAEHGG